MKECKTLNELIDYLYKLKLEGKGEWQTIEDHAEIFVPIQVNHYSNDQTITFGTRR